MNGRVRCVPVAVALVALAACSTSSPSLFPAGITFDQQALTKATEWTRGGMSGVVYVPPGQTLPSASPQIGAIISNEHTTAAALHQWIAEQTIRSGAFQAHSSGSTEESCRVGMSMGDEKRAYLTLQVCKTGVARAVCVEADETLEPRMFERCLNDSARFDEICDQRWLVRRRALDALVADVLTIR
jgi:hypothetical protein